MAVFSVFQVNLGSTETIEKVFLQAGHCCHLTNSVKALNTS